VDLSGELCSRYGDIPHQNAVVFTPVISGTTFYDPPICFQHDINFIHDHRITIISVLGLNVLTGCCGQISMGHSGFMAVGGYVLAILSAKLGWPFWVALPAAGLISGLIGNSLRLALPQNKRFFI